MVSTSSLKNFQKLKNALLKHLQHSFLSTRYFQNPFLRCFLRPNFDLNSFERFASLSQKTVSTSPLKNFQITEKYPFETLTTFVFELSVISKPFYVKLPMTKFWFRKSLMLCLTFPENGYNFLTQKFSKNWKMSSMGKWGGQGKNHKINNLNFLNY